MSTQMTAERRRNTVFCSNFSTEGGVSLHSRQDEGGEVLTLRGVPVFRSGTFRDSMGFQHTWDELHIKQMVDNYSSLSQRGIVPDVPVRRGHGALFGDPIDGVIGYHVGLRSEQRASKVDGKVYEYLLADYDILDPSAITKIKSGLWRNLSSEIGTYVTNDEAEYFPVYMGVAYVDFPAVEGLREHSRNNSTALFNGTDFSLIEEGEGMSQIKHSAGEKGQVVVNPVGVPGAAAQEPPESNDPTGGEAAAEETPAGEQSAEETPAEEIPAGEQSAEETPAEESIQAKQDDDETPVEVQPAEVPSVVAHAASGAQTATFSINGQPTSDFAAVQAHITALEEFKRVESDNRIVEFVNGLAEEGKIFASQIDPTLAFARSLRPEQVDAWKAQYNDAVPHSLLANHGVGDSRMNQPEKVEEYEKEKGRYEVLKETIRQFKLGGYSNEKVEAMDIYSEFKSLDAKFGEEQK